MSTFTINGDLATEVAKAKQLLGRPGVRLRVETTGRWEDTSLFAVEENGAEHAILPVSGIDIQIRVGEPVIARVTFMHDDEPAVVAVLAAFIKEDVVVILDYLERVIPGRFLRSPLARAVMSSAFAIVDGLIDYARDAVAAAQPGQVDGVGFDLGGFPDVDALPYIGRDRGIVQGTAESPGDYASRLRKWRAIRAAAGTSWGVLSQVQAILGPVRVRLVSDHGWWWTLEADGTRKLHTSTGVGGFWDSGTAYGAISTPSHPWNWDGAPKQGDCWIIVDCHDLIPGVVFDDGPTYGVAEGSTSYGAGAHWGLGLGALGDELQARLQETLDRYGAAGVLHRYVIFTFDDGSFDPETPGPYPAAGMPDGTWGRPHKNIDGVQVPSRAAFARYWKPTQV